MLLNCIITAIKEGHARFTNMYIFPQEMLETLLSILDCPENCYFLLKNNIISILKDVLLQFSKDSLCLELAQQCLNKLFTLIVSNQEGKDQQYRKYVKVNGLMDVLKKLDEKDLNHLSITSRICIYKIQNFSYGKIIGECTLENLCRRFLRESIKIEGNLNVEFDYK